MTVYIDLVVLINGVVDLLLLAGTNRLTGNPVRLGRCIAASVIGGIYGGLCVIPGITFLANPMWRVASLVGIGVTAFGIGEQTVRRCTLFLLLSMSLGGLALLMGGGGFGKVFLGALVIVGLCIYGLKGRLPQRSCVPVCLEWKGRRMELVALRDTGNFLSDPVTGNAVLIVGRQIAREMAGLEEEQLKHPVETMEKMPLMGLRLIPFSTAGRQGGMLLALRMDRVLIEGKDAYRLVAFSPVCIGKGEGYQALTGG